MATNPNTDIEFSKLEVFIDRKQNVVAYVYGLVNDLPFEGVAYFENELYNTIDLFSLVKLKSAQSRMIKMKLKKEVLAMKDQHRHMITRIDNAGIMQHGKIFKELDSKHNGHPIALNVPDKDRPLVQELGGIWNPIIKQWVVLSKNPNIRKFNQWTIGAVY